MKLSKKIGSGKLLTKYLFTLLITSTLHYQELKSDCIKSPVGPGCQCVPSVANFVDLAVSGCLSGGTVNNPQVLKVCTDLQVGTIVSPTSLVVPGYIDGLIRSEMLAYVFNPNSQVINNGSIGQIFFTNDLINPGSHFNVALGKWIAPVTGYYLIAPSLLFLSAGGDSTVIKFLLANQAITEYTFPLDVIGGGARDWTSLPVIVFLNQGDSFSIIVDHTGGAAPISVDRAALLISVLFKV